MEKKFAVLSVFFAALVLLFPSACSKNSTSKTSQGTSSLNQPEQRGKTSLGDEGKRKLVFGTLKKNKSPAVPALSVTSSGPASVHVEFPGLPSKGTIVPNDMLIGPLEDFDSLPVEERRAYSVIEKFFGMLFKGDGDPGKYLSPISGDVLLNVIGKVQPSPVELRIGAFTVSTDGAVTAEIRVITPIGRSSGEITAEKIKGVWYVGALSMDFESLDKNYKREGKEFEPDSYRNLELEY